MLAAMHDHLTGRCTTQELREKHPQVNAGVVVAKKEAIKSRKIRAVSWSLATERALHKGPGYIS
eukprot:433546-Prorocentrum_minimum.AAC.2